MKVYFPLEDSDTINLFKNEGWDITKDINDVHIKAIVFTGGEDVTPFLYGETPLGTTKYNPERDMKEIKIYNFFSSKNFMKIGICRGGQLLNVLNGGSLYQHVNNHNTMHDATCLLTKKTFKVTSTHHQMMIPTLNSEVILVSNMSTKKEKHDYLGNEYVETINTLENKNNVWDYEDVEACFYDYTNSLCYQPHPEYLSTMNNDNKNYFNLCVSEFSKRCTNEKTKKG